VTERIKLERSPVTAPSFDREFSPVCDCETNVANLTLRLRRAERVDATIVDADGERVRALATNERLARGEHTLVWDGRDDTGAIAPDGLYRLRIHLDDERRTILVPTTVRLDTTVPVAELVGVRPEVFSPDGDERKDTVKVIYRSSEEGRPELSVDGEPVLLARNRAKGQASVNWNGELGGEPVEAGTYGLSIRVHDLAGNVSEPTERAPVRARFIELDEEDYLAQAGGSLTFTVSTDASPFDWALIWARKKAPRTPFLHDTVPEAGSVSVLLPAETRPGRYVLRVTANGHEDRASVTVVQGGS
jgi:hypothetical protein